LFCVYNRIFTTYSKLYQQVFYLYVQHIVTKISTARGESEQLEMAIRDKAEIFNYDQLRQHLAISRRSGAVVFHPSNKSQVR